MKTNSIFRVLFVFGLIPTAAWAEEIKPSIDMTQAIELTAQTPKGVTIERGDVGDLFTLRYAGNESVFTPIFEIPTGGIDNCRLEFGALMSSGEETQKAYIEMWCVVNGQSYFSKALDQVFTGQQDWKEVATPFFLKQGEKVEKAILGVRFEGSGAVAIHRISLKRYDNTALGRLQSNWQWIPGTLFGVLAGCYGAFAGIMAPKGKARSLVMGIGIFFECASVLMLIAGMVLWIQGFSYATWYGILLPGVIGSAIFSQIFITIPRAYNLAETRKMQAKDILGN